MSSRASQVAWPEAVLSPSDAGVKITATTTESDTETVVDAAAPVIQKHASVSSQVNTCCLQCFDAVDWAAGRASGL